jgi:hypothetical protein
MTEPKGTRMRRALVAALAVSAASCGLAFADPPLQPPPQVEAAVSAKFAELDRDGDGLLSRLECSRMPGLLESYLKYDTDKDGKLNREEFTRAAAPLLAAYRR